MLPINFIKKKGLFGLFKMLAVFKGGLILKLGINPAKILKYINLIFAIPKL